MSQAEHIARALGGKRSGRGWIACCPVHGDTSPSLSLRDSDNGRLLVKCFPGCTWQEIFAAFRQLGLTTTYSSANHTEARPEQSENPNIVHAQKIWQEVRPAAGTFAETYLRSRGLSLPRSNVIGFHPSLRHGSGFYYPAMVALVQHGRSDKPLGIHRTYLTSNGTGKANIESNKMMLGSVSGGAVKLFKAGKKLAIAEGIETALAVYALTKIPVWAALSAGGMETLTLPPLPVAQEIIISADNDPSGRGEQAAEKAGAYWQAEGRKVRVIKPQDVGTDFNDVLILKQRKKGK